MRRLFEMRNNFVFARHLDAGYCFGMSCDWAMKSLKSVRNQGVKHAGELEEFRWVIGQTAYETKVFVNDLLIADTALITGMGLRVESYHRFNIRGMPWFHVCLLIHRQARFGTFVFCIQGEGGSHAMVYRRVRTLDVLGRQTTSLQWFDPNDGLFDFDDQGDFARNAGNELDNSYGIGQPDPNDRLDESIALFRVRI